MASGSSGRSVPWSGWTGARRPSEYKRPEVHTPDYLTVPVERCRPAGVHALERRAEDLETLFGGGGEDGHAIVCLFV